MGAIGYGSRDYSGSKSSRPVLAIIAVRYALLRDPVPREGISGAPCPRRNKFSAASFRSNGNSLMASPDRTAVQARRPLVSDCAWRAGIVAIPRDAVGFPGNAATSPYRCRQPGLIPGDDLSRWIRTERAGSATNP